MEVERLTLFGAFLLGLAHTLVPCEDKAVVSLYALWRSERWKEGISLVVLYGLGMTLINTCFGFAFAFAGVSLLEVFEGIKKILEAIAGAITIAFGFFMLTGHSLIHLAHHHGETVKKRETKPYGRFAALLFGVARGLPPCPFELAAYLWAASIGNILVGTLTVFTFGLGTTIGLVPLGFVMGELASVAKRTRYSALVPKLCGFIIIIIGTVLAISSLLGIEI